MPLTVIKGPPNSGRTDLIQQLYLESLPRNPVLVVPGVDDIFAWERRLTRETGAMIDGQIVHFRDLFSEILKHKGTSRPAETSDLHRRYLTAGAVRSGWPEIGDRLVNQPGLVDAVLGEIDDFRNEMIDPDTLESRIRESEKVRHLLHLVKVYRAYIESLSTAGVTDAPNEAVAAMDTLNEIGWDRPVLFAGFDELTPLQLEVIGRLAFGKGADLTVAVSHDADNPALELTDHLIGEMGNLGPADAITWIETERPGHSPAHDDLLYEIQKRFMQPGSDSAEPLECTDALTVLGSTGNRNEAEAIAAEIAMLIDRGAEPDQIAVAIEAPAKNGRVLRDTLTRFSIPVSLECETPVEATTIGRAVLSLLAATSAGGSTDDLLCYLRSPVGPDTGLVDAFERSERIKGDRPADSAAETLKARTGAFPFRWEELKQARTEGSAIDEIIGEVIDRAIESILRSPGAPHAGDALAAETMAGSAISAACGQLSRLGDGRSTALALAEALSSGSIKVWTAAARGTVRIASPYSLRSKRFRYLFVASLQEAGLSDPERPGPFLSARERGSLGMSERRDPEVQQRYLFYSCLTVPTERLWLSYRDSDETGKAEHPSPLIGAVEELFCKGDDGEAVLSRGGRSGSAVTFDPAYAPSENELARAVATVAASGTDPVPTLSGLETDLADRTAARLESAEATEARSRRLSDLSLESIKTALTDNAVFGATEIEAYAGCPYRWFIERQLRPEPFEPDPDYLAMGSLIHGVLEDLYSAHPGEIPRPNSVSGWIDAVPSTVDERSARRGIELDRDSAAHAALRSRAVQLVSGYLRREAGRRDPLHLPWKLEADFGRSESAEPRLKMGDWALVGVLDRIDLSPETGTDRPRQAVVVDYKSGKVSDRRQEKAGVERKVQIQLYMHAVRKIWKAEPVAGIYVPIRANDARSRGAWDADLKGEMLDRGASEKDKLDDLDQFIADGIAMANRAAAGLMSGELDHDPALCPDHFDHPAVPDRPGRRGEDSDGNGGGS